MALFRRKKKTSPDVDEATAPSQGEVDASEDAGASPSASSQETAEPQESTRGGEVGVTRGPWDSASAPRAVSDYVTLGALWLPAIDGITLTFEMDQQQNRVTAVRVVAGDQSALQLQAFAAPRSRGIWDEIRAELLESVTAAGGTAEEVDGADGPELIVSPRGADGRPVSPMRFLGIDGPRWFLRGVVTGAAATNPELTQHFREFVQHIVVHRGDEPMGPRELLPLALPQEPQPSEPEQEPGRSASDLDPFTRGPEITEIR